MIGQSKTPAPFLMCDWLAITSLVSHAPCVSGASVEPSGPRKRRCLFYDKDAKKVNVDGWKCGNVLILTPQPAACAHPRTSAAAFSSSCKVPGASSLFRRDIRQKDAEGPHFASIAVWRQPTFDSGAGHGGRSAPDRGPAARMLAQLTANSRYT